MGNRGSLSRAMQVLNILLVGLVCLSCVHGAKSKNNYNTKKMKLSKSDMDTIQPSIDKLRADLTLLQKCLNTSRSDPKWSTYCVEPPASFSSTANQVPSGRRGAVEAPEDRSTAATAADVFSVADMYLSGYSTRCGAQNIVGWTNSLDIYYAAAADNDWRSTGTCLIRLLTAGQTVYIRNNAGGGNDCVEETSWRYGRLAMYMVAPSA